MPRLLVIHNCGNADLGIGKIQRDAPEPGSATSTKPEDSPQGAAQRAAADRIRELGAASPGAKATMLIQGAGYRDETISSHASMTPLGGILTHHFHHVPAESYTSIDVVLIGTKTGVGATAPVACALSKALGEAAPHLPWHRTPTNYTPVLLQTVKDTKLRERLTEHGLLGKRGSVPEGGDILVALSGAQAILLQSLVIGIDSGAPMYAYWQTNPTGPGQPARVNRWSLPDTTADARVSWLYRLGYPALALQDAAAAGISLSDTEHAAIVAEQRALEAVGEGVGTVDDLADWVRMDLRRADGFEGLALRAWVDNKYEQLRGPRNPTTSTVPDPRKDAEQVAKQEGLQGDVPLSKVLEIVRKWPDGDRRLGTPQGEFLKRASSAAVFKQAARSNHEGELLFAAKRSEASSLIDEYTLRQRPAGPLGKIQPPSGRLALVHATPRQPLGGGESLNPSHFSSEIRRSCGMRDDRQHGLDFGPVTIEYLIVATPFTKKKATEQKKALKKASTDRLILKPQLKDSENDTQEAYDVARKWLGQLDPVDAVVVAPIGSRELMLGILSAALEYGATMAVPIWVDWSSESHRPLEHTHQLTRYLGIDVAAIAGARAAVASLNLSTAARLLSLGTQQLVEASHRVTNLQKELFKPAGTAGLLTIAAWLLRNPEQLSNAELLRIFHIAVERAKAVLRPHRGKSVEERSAICGVPADQCNQVETVVTLALEVRNRMQFNHGRPLHKGRPLDEFLDHVRRTVLDLDQQQALAGVEFSGASELLEYLRGLVITTQADGNEAEEEAGLARADALFDRWDELEKSLNELAARAARPSAARLLHSIVTQEPQRPQEPPS